MKPRKPTPPSPGAARGGTVHVLRLSPERALDRASKKFLSEPTLGCPKCGSTFVGREPAFLHCFYCGKMARVANGSMLEQELFELRSGLRLAS